MLKYIIHSLKQSRLWNEYEGYRNASKYSLSPYEAHYATKNLKKHKAGALIGIPSDKIDYSQRLHLDPTVLSVLEPIDNTWQDYSWNVSSIRDSSPNYVWLFVAVDDPHILVYLKMKVKDERFKHVELQG